MPCTCVCNTSCNQPKVVQEPEITILRGKEQQQEVGDASAVGSMYCMIKPTLQHDTKGQMF